jgi:hypothetical protein
MKFFTAILSALALSVSTTSATPIDSSNITKRQTYVYAHMATITLFWSPSQVPPVSWAQVGTLSMGIYDGHSEVYFSKLSLSPPSAHARRLELVFPPVADLGKLNLCATSPFSTPDLAWHCTAGLQSDVHNPGRAIRKQLLLQQ